MRSAEVDVWLDLRKVDIARSKEDTTAAFVRIRSDLQRLNSAWRSASERMTDEAQREDAARSASYVVVIGNSSIASSWHRTQTKSTLFDQR